ncbi:MAG: hypothetical protein KJP09_07515 [Bacteroidia bacterium]|nr:hypothetical protein [Bacteroidia bacterium]MBT8310514.1 hypothetical protein [Bacteroidia bacterium]NND11608.1 hypothetical protein [Flavobacteriaceae bacterium]NNK27722.1 hypothetical protein [Flavobacteriaceae bacterium]
MKKQLNTTVIYILSILGLLCCCIFGSGILLSGPAFFMANNKIKDAQMNPDDYEGDIKAMNTAKIVALVVMILNVLMIIRVIYVISTVGWDELMEQSQEMMEQMQQQ